MIEVLKQHLSADMRPEEKLNTVRELLQITALKIMYDKNIFNNIAFVGGTALRILFDIKRFSEDLDFSLFAPEGYDFSNINMELLRGFKLNGLNVESKLKTDTNVHSTFLKFSGLLKTLGLSVMENQKLSIKLEVDTNPPEGWRIENSIVTKLYMLNLTHFDLPSSFATKLHACFFRKFTKGRDFYDFVWYMGKKIKPNYLLLNNAIKQTEGFDPGLTEQNFKAFLLENIEKIDFTVVKKDVERFVEDKNDLKLFDSKIIKSAIESLFW